MFAQACQYLALYKSLTYLDPPAGSTGRGTALAAARNAHDGGKDIGATHLLAMHYEGNAGASKIDEQLSFMRANVPTAYNTVLTVVTVASGHVA